MALSLSDMRSPLPATLFCESVEEFPNTSCPSRGVSVVGVDVICIALHCLQTNVFFLGIELRPRRPVARTRPPAGAVRIVSPM